MNKKQFLVNSLLSYLKVQWVRSDDNSIQTSNLNISDYPWLMKQKDVKPILRPLSDLILPCLKGGKIPLFELCDIERYDCYWSDGGGKRLIDDPFFKSQKLVEHDSYESFWSFGFHTKHKFFYGYVDVLIESDPENGQTNITNQIELWQWMIDNHFDICGLIEIGEAIDVNTLDINPYNI